MKKASYLVAITTIICMSFSGCYPQRPISSSKSKNNSTYNVQYLFEHEGCKVYRFRDYGGNYVYFTNCTGDVTVAYNDSVETTVQTIVKSNMK